VVRPEKLLDESLENVGLRRKGLLTTTVVKSRAFQNRVPWKEEGKTFIQAGLRRQKEVIDPTIVCLSKRHCQLSIESLLFEV
jgi:uracil-DNA glycosylase family 4